MGEARTEGRKVRRDGTRTRATYLLDVSRDAPAVEGVEAVEGPGRRRRRLRLHLRRHVGVLHHSPSFQHGARVPAQPATAAYSVIRGRRRDGSESEMWGARICALQCIPPSLFICSSRGAGRGRARGHGCAV